MNEASTFYIFLMVRSEEGIEKVLYIFEFLTFLLEDNLESLKKDLIYKIADFLRKFYIQMKS